MLFVIILLLELSVFIFFVAESRHILPQQQQLLCIVVRDQQCGAAAAAEFLCFFLPSPYLWLRRFSPRLVSSRPRSRAVFVPFVFWHNNWPDQQLFVPAQRRFLLSFTFKGSFCLAPLHCLILLLSTLFYLVSFCLRVFDFVFGSFFLAIALAAGYSFLFFASSFIFALAGRL